jgi:hypothetical protein
MEERIMKKLEAWFENGIDGDALAKICEILINYDAKFYVLEEPEYKGDPLCCFFKGGECKNSFKKVTNCVGLRKEGCPLGKS